jgi:cytochrome c-type biogenesis protein
MTPVDPLLLVPGAFIAGILMFLAPCTLPIVPGYLVFIAGSGAGEGTDNRRRILLNAFAFALGFSVVFILLGTFAAALGALIGPWRDLVGRAAGALIILFGLTMIGILRIPMLGREWHARLPRFLTIGRPESSLLIGVLFALGWSPCIGPILGTVLLLASTSTTALQGAMLLGVFSLGLAVPFLLTAILIDAAAIQFARWGRALAILSTLGGVLLITIGVCMMLGLMGSAVSFGYGLFDALGYNRLYQYF